MASVSKMKEEILHEFLKCPICLDSFKNPRYMPCLHAVCTDCLKGCMQGNRTFPCPICKKDTYVPEDGALGFPVAFHMNALQDYITNSGPNRPTIPCYNKKDQAEHANSSVKCLDCNVYYCDDCTKAHTLVAVAEHHETVPVQELTQEHFRKASQKQVTFCQQHPTCPLNYYCKNEACQIPVCQRCNMTKHKLHESIDLAEVSAKYRRENENMLQNDFLQAEQALVKRIDEFKKSIQNLNKQFKKNKKIVHNRYLKMKKALQTQEQKVTDDIEKVKDKNVQDCEQKIREIDTKLSFLGTTRTVIENMTHFSPDDMIVKQHKELQRQTAKTLDVTAPPDLWIDNTKVTSVGEPIVDMKLVSKNRSHKTVKCFDGHVEGVVLLDEFFVTWRCHSGDTPTDFFVSGQNTTKAETLKRKLEKICPQAYTIVPMKQDENEVLVIVEPLKYAPHHIKIMNINDYKCETIQLEKSMHPYAVAVDGHNDVIFTDFLEPNAIRKITKTFSKTKSEVQTIFENDDDNDVLSRPWRVCINMNNDIIVSDCRKKSLIIFDETGIVRKTYNNFTAGKGKDPSGVCTDNKGNIYVCDRYGHCIHKLDKDGVFMEKILTQNDGLSDPIAVKYSNRMLVVGQSKGYVTYFKI